jgi:hypothetical protein
VPQLFFLAHIQGFEADCVEGDPYHWHVRAHQSRHHLHLSIFPLADVAGVQVKIYDFFGDSTVAKDLAHLKEQQGVVRLLCHQCTLCACAVMGGRVRVRVMQLTHTRRIMSWCPSASRPSTRSSLPPSASCTLVLRRGALAASWPRAERCSSPSSPTKSGAQVRGPLFALRYFD